jgi:hypothetical protein
VDAQHIVGRMMEVKDEIVDGIIPRTCVAVEVRLAEPPANLQH